MLTVFFSKDRLGTCISLLFILIKLPTLVTTFPRHINLNSNQSQTFPNLILFQLVFPPKLYFPASNSPVRTNTLGFVYLVHFKMEHTQTRKKIFQDSAYPNRYLHYNNTYMMRLSELYWTGHLNDTGITFMLFSLNTVIMRVLQTITPPIQSIKHTVYLACV